MNLDDYYILGRIGKKHGLKGEFSLILDVDDPNNYEEITYLYIANDTELIPYIVEKIHIRPNKIVAKFEDVDSPEELNALLNKPVYLPLSELPVLSDEQYYFHDLVGCQVIDLEKGALGKVTNVLEMPMQMLFEIDYNGIQVLIPINDELISKVNKSEETIHLVLPEGLLDVYLDSDKNDSDEN